MTLTIPELSLVVLIGPSGCGKSTFAKRHFKPTEVMSSDGFRALVSDDENDQSSTDDAFAALHFVHCFFYLILRFFIIFFSHDFKF